jgi:hypothetical protein
VFPSFALLLAPSSCRRGHGAGAAGVDEWVPDLALARDQIRSVMIGAELGRGSKSGLYRRRGDPFTVS